MVGLALALSAMFLVACGGGETTTVTVPPAETTQATTTTMTTEMATTATAAASGTEAFDAAAAQVVEATNALMALRAECLAADDVPGCMAAKEADFTSAETTLADALATAATEATAAGAPPDFCQANLETIAGRVSAERAALVGRFSPADGEFDGFSGPAGNGNWAYYDTLLQQFGSDPGYIVALGLGDCRLALAGDAPNAQLLDKTLAFTFGAIRTRNDIGFGAWGLHACLGGAEGADLVFCLQQVSGGPDFSERAAGLAESIGKMQAGFDEMSASPGYADLSSTCKSAFEDANEQWAANGNALEQVYADVDAKGLASSASPPAGAARSAYDATESIVATTRAETTPPLDETTLVMCLEEVAAQGA